MLLDAFARTPGLADVGLMLVGDGTERAALEKQAASLGIRDRVTFCGTRRDLGNLLPAMDIFALPSLWEGLPLALILAMGAARPVVATRIAGIPEVVVDGENGLLVPPGDVAAIGTALARLCADPAERSRMGGAAREAVRDRFGADAYARSVTDLYEEFLGRVEARPLAPGGGGMTMTIPIAGFNRSGGVKTLALLANAMADRGWHVRIVVPDYASESPFALAAAVELRRINTSGWPASLRMAVFYLALAHIAARDTDVCVANFYLTAYCAWLSRLLTGGRARSIFCKATKPKAMAGWPTRHSSAAGSATRSRVVVTVFHSRCCASPRGFGGRWRVRTPSSWGRESISMSFDRVRAWRLACASSLVRLEATRA